MNVIIPRLYIEFYLEKPHRFIITHAVMINKASINSSVGDKISTAPVFAANSSSMLNAQDKNLNKQKGASLIKSLQSWVTLLSN